MEWNQKKQHTSENKEAVLKKNIKLNHFSVKHL